MTIRQFYVPTHLSLAKSVGGFQTLSGLALSNAPPIVKLPSSPFCAHAGICQNCRSRAAATLTIVVFKLIGFVYASAPVPLVEFHPSSSETQLKIAGDRQKVVQKTLGNWYSLILEKQIVYITKNSILPNKVGNQIMSFYQSYVFQYG